MPQLPKFFRSASSQTNTPTSSGNDQSASVSYTPNDLPNTHEEQISEALHGTYQDAMGVHNDSSVATRTPEPQVEMVKTTTEHRGTIAPSEWVNSIRDWLSRAADTGLMRGGRRVFSTMKASADSTGTAWNELTGDQKMRLVAFGLTGLAVMVCAVFVFTQCLKERKVIVSR